MGPKSRLPKPALPSLLRNLSAEAGDGRASSSRWGPVVHRPSFCEGGGPDGTQSDSLLYLTLSRSLSPYRSRSDHRLRSGREDARKAARTKAPKLHRRLSLKFCFFSCLHTYNVHKSTQNPSFVSEGVCAAPAVANPELGKEYIIIINRFYLIYWQASRVTFRL